MAGIHILNAEGKVRHFEIKPLGRRVRKLDCVACVDGRVLAKGRGGALYNVAGFPDRGYSYIGWTWHWLPDMADALHQLGLISKADAQATKAQHAKARAKDDWEFKVGQLQTAVKNLGFKLTKSQLKKLERA